ncbi:MAG: lipocalin family protein [Pseudomonadota bacterium]
MKQLLALALTVLAASAAAQDLRPVTGFDVTRYLGTWHEVAAIPVSFQQQCVYDTRADYELADEPNRVTVANSCRTADGTVDEARGVARFVGEPDVGHLEVTFVELFGFPLWLASGDYVIIALDEDYRWSVVAHPSRDYAWILAREPELDTATLRRLEAVYAEAGYDTCRILTSRAVRNDIRQPLCTLDEPTAEGG